jgi:hypothetical protein
VKRLSKGFFFEKKKQKTFISRAMGVGVATTRGPAAQKFFAPLFFKKAATSLSGVF